LPNTGRGDLTGITNEAHVIWVPTGYNSNSPPLSGGFTYDNQSFSSLGITPGTYEWTWGTGTHADSFTLDIIAPAAVPEPASFAVLAMGLAGLGMVLRTRRA